MSGEATGRVIVVDTDAAWDAIVTSPRVRRLAPRDVRHVADEPADAVLVNLAAPGALEALAAWPRRHVPHPSGCVTVPGRDELVTLRGVAVVAALRPADPIAVHVRRRRRRARVVAAGGSAGALLALRRVLAADGMGVSIAWDAQQACDLFDLVHPHVVVLDLAVARGGHDLVLGLGRRQYPPDLVLVPAPGDARAFAAAFERLRRRERLPSRRDAVSALVARRPEPGLRAPLPTG